MKKKNIIKDVDRLIDIVSFIRLIKHAYLLIVNLYYVLIL